MWEYPRQDDMTEAEKAILNTEIIDDVSIYDRALSPDEIMDMFNAVNETIGV